MMHSLRDFVIENHASGERTGWYNQPLLIEACSGAVELPDVPGVPDMKLLEEPVPVSRWTTEPDDLSAEPWPVVGIPCPEQHTATDGVGMIVGRYTAGPLVIVVFDYLLPEGCDPNDTRYTRSGLRVRVYPRKSDAEYWPTAPQCEFSVSTWADALETCMRAYVGQDCDAAGEDAAGHWLWAKRRYELKNNQTTRLAYLTGVDPEGRHRFRPSRPMPAHVERWLRYADFLVGVRVGVRPSDMTPDDLYASGGALNAEELLTWCRAQCVAGVGLRRRDLAFLRTPRP